MQNQGFIYGFRVKMMNPAHGYVYYFGRTRNAKLLSEQFEIEDESSVPQNRILNEKICRLLRRCGRVGLNAAGRVVFLKRSTNLTQDFRIFFARLLEVDWLESEAEVGSHWFSSHFPEYVIQQFVRSMYDALLQTDNEQQERTEFSADLLLLAEDDMTQQI